MTDLWYFADGGQPRGPLSLAELIPQLSRIADPRRVMIWRHGFEDWKALEEVREVAQHVFRPPPIRAASPPPPLPPAREPPIAAEDAAEFKNVKPELTGIGGWLGLLAFGQVVGLLKLLVSLGQYYQSLDDQLWKRFPTAVWGEATLNAVGVWLAVYTTALLFRHSRNFPRFFIFQMLAAIVLPIVDLFWLASIFAISLNQPVSNYLALEPKEAGPIIAGMIGAAIWIPYMYRSRRVANTFTK